MKDKCEPQADQWDVIAQKMTDQVEQVTGHPSPALKRVVRLMSPSEYAELATDPVQWFNKAAGLELGANTMWSHCVDAFQTPGKAILFPGYLEASHLLFGLSAEVALKGELIRINPQNVILETSTDNSGAVRKVSFKGIKDVRGDGHDLVQLAKRAGRLENSDEADLRNVLGDFTACIRWQSRYPVPKFAKGDGAEVSFRFVYKQRWLKDWIRPLLDDLIGPYRATA